MAIQHIKIKDLRNLQNVSLSVGAGFNLFYGLNGSGKTSFLEGIFMLGHGRSFREHYINRIVRDNQSKLSVFATISQPQSKMLAMGIERESKGKSRYKVGNDFIVSAAKLAQILPIKLINASSYQLLEAGPQFRRQYLDWGMFHVEHTFYGYWKESQRILKQRNALLRDHSSLEHEIDSWDIQLVNVTLELHRLRLLYFQALIKNVTHLLMELLPNFPLKFSYYPGWPQKQSFLESLQCACQKDRECGYTQYGPHRMDLKITIHNKPAHSVLSRGQQKILVNVLHLAQGLLMKNNYNKPCIYLIDDLPAELDRVHRQKIVKLLHQLESQVFVTAVDYHDLKESFNGYLTKMFHVEQGIIQVVE